MGYHRSLLLWLSAVFSAYILVLVCFFHDTLIESHLNLKVKSNSVSISKDAASDADHQIEKLEKMWQEKLIEDLFKGTLSSPEEEDGTLSPDESTTLVARKHTLTPEPQFFGETVGDQFSGQRLKESFQQDLSDTFKQPADKDKLSQSNIKDRLAELMPMGEHSTMTVPKARDPITLKPGENILTGSEGKTDEDLETSKIVVLKTIEENIEDDDKNIDQSEIEQIEISDQNVHELDTEPQESESKRDIRNPTITKTSSPKMVLVMTQSRHGSTWLMDMLSYSHQTLPVFEPLNSVPFLKMYSIRKRDLDESVALGYDPVKYADWREVYLARICLCDWYGVKIPGVKGDKHYEGIRGLKYKSSRYSTGVIDKDRSVKEVCNEEGTMMVPKTIRYYNMTTLYKIKDFGCDNFKVIHLVRDPRAVMTSRMSVFHELYDGNALLGAQIPVNEGQDGFDQDYMTTAADWMCSHHLENYKLGMNPPLWLKGRYKMVRYEDLAEFPDRVTRELLDFVGVNYSSKYAEYVYNITHVKDRGKNDNGVYGVERQSREIIGKWKEKLLESHWRTIEKVCAEMMEVFKYKPTFEDLGD
ncbi:hypothetical protein ACHWQZ_G010224 [Mnemiopsis leidyi]